MSIKETLTRVADSLDEIRVPVAMANEIARPIWEAVTNIRQCAEMIQGENDVTPAEEEVTADV